MSFFKNTIHPRGLLMSSRQRKGKLHIAMRLTLCLRDVITSWRAANSSRVAAFLRFYLPL